MTINIDVISQVQSFVADLSGVPVEDITPDLRLLEDLGLDSLQITELAQKLENVAGRSIDEDLLNVEGTTVARCAEIVKSV